MTQQISIYHIAYTTWCDGREVRLSPQQWKVMTVLADGPATIEEISHAVYGFFNTDKILALREVIRHVSMRYFVHSKDICKNSDGKYALPEGVVVRQFKN